MRLLYCKHANVRHKDGGRPDQAMARSDAKTCPKTWEVLEWVEGEPGSMEHGL